MAFNVTLNEVGIKSCALKLAYLKSIQAILKIIEMVNFENICGSYS